MIILNRGKGQKQVYYCFRTMLIFILVSLIIPVYNFGQTKSSLDFKQVVLSIVHDQLQQVDPGMSEKAIERIAQKSNLSEKEVRVRLLSLLDTLEIHRQKKTQLWQELISSGGNEVAPKNAETFLIHLLFRDTRKALSGDANYLLKNMLKTATQKAKLTIDGKEFLFQILNEKLGKEAFHPRYGNDLPEKMGLWVEVKNRFIEEAQSPHSHLLSYLNTPDNIYSYIFKSKDPNYIVERLTQFHQFILPALLEKLPQSPRIKWAVENPTPLLKPDYFLVVDIVGLQIVRKESNPIPVSCLSGLLELQNIHSKISVFREGFEACIVQRDVEAKDLLEGTDKEFAEEIQKSFDIILSEQ